MDSWWEAAKWHTEIDLELNFASTYCLLCDMEYYLIILNNHFVICDTKLITPTS